MQNSKMGINIGMQGFSSAIEEQYQGASPRNFPTSTIN